MGSAIDIQIVHAVCCMTVRTTAMLNNLKKQFSTDFLENLNLLEYEVAALLGLKFTKTEIISINELTFGRNLSLEKMIEKGFSMDRIKIVFYLFNEEEAAAFFNDNLENIILTTSLAPDILCSICLEDFKVGTKVVRIKECKHMYHEECILTWFREKKICPNCNANDDYPALLKEWYENNIYATIILKQMQNRKQYIKLIK